MVEISHPQLGSKPIHNEGPGDAMFEHHLPYTFQKHINITADRKLWFEYLEQLLTVLQQSEGRNNLEVTKLTSVF